MGVKISNLTYHLPDKVLSNEDLAIEFEGFQKDVVLDKIGIETRHIAGDSESALDLAYAAANSILEQIDRNTVSFLLYCTQSPDYLLPTNACVLQDKLGLPKDCGALDFNLGCSGYAYGLALAKGLITSRVCNNVLFLTSDTYTKYIHRSDRGNRIIFGDAATATFLEYSNMDNIGEFALGTDGNGAEHLGIKNGGLRNGWPNFSEENSPNNFLYMNGPEVFSFTIKAVPELVEKILSNNETNLEEVDYVIFHQANKYMLNHLREKLKIPKEKFYIDLEKVGNTVSSSIPIALTEAIKNGLVSKGDKVLIVGFGVGLSYGGTVITI